MSVFLDKIINAQNILYKNIGANMSNFKEEEEGQEYCAAFYMLSSKHIKFRVAKVTPTKLGQFVTLWKRDGKCPIRPYDKTDPVDYVIVNVLNNDKIGQFVFPKDILVKKNIFSVNGIGGKRAMRVYSPWDKVISKQAQLTQKWQIEYFIEITPGKSIDFDLANRLYSI